MKRGQVYWIKAVPTVGSEQSKNRPGVIIQNDIGNERSTTVIVAYMTSNGNKYQTTHCKCQYGTILTEQLATVCKSRIQEHMGELSEQELVNLEKALNASLSINTPVLSITAMLKEQQSIANNEILQLEKQVKLIKEQIEILTNKHIGLQYALEALDTETDSTPVVTPVIKIKETTINNPLAREITEYMLKNKRNISITELMEKLRSTPSRSRVSDTIYKHLKPTGLVIPVDRGVYKISEEAIAAFR